MKEKITLSLDQHENARHGEEIFPLQKYVTPLWKEYPYVTAHWHEEAEFTRIEKGSCTYQIHLETYDVEEGDLIALDIERRTLDIVGIRGERKPAEEIDAELARRRAAWRPKPSPNTKGGVLQLFSLLASSPMKGAYLEFDSDRPGSLDQGEKM